MRKEWLYGAILLLALWLPAWGQEERQTGWLRVQCDQGGALVFVDRTLVGNAPIEVEEPAGEHLVRISIDENWFPYEKTVTIKPGERVTVTARLRRSSAAAYRAGLDAFNGGHWEDAWRDFRESLSSPGKTNPDAWFYLGMIEEQAQQNPDALRDYSQFAQFRNDYPAVFYHLGKVRQALGQDGPAATAYKLALLHVEPSDQALLQSAPPPTSENIAQLRRSGETSAQVQLAYLLELKGNLAEARDLYRQLTERAALAHQVDLNLPEAPAAAPQPAATDAPPAPDASPMP
ncbi:MAG: PEGA domain-containing protein [Candidatus Xenobia bacterium]